MSQSNSEKKDEIKICQNPSCEKEIPRGDLPLSIWKRKKFCNKQCYQEYRKKQAEQAEEKDSLIESDIITDSKMCERPGCGNEFFRAPNITDEQWEKAKFCSPLCAIEVDKDDDIIVDQTETVEVIKQSKSISMSINPQGLSQKLLKDGYGAFFENIVKGGEYIKLIHSNGNIPPNKLEATYKKFLEFIDTLNDLRS